MWVERPREWSRSTYVRLREWLLPTQPEHDPALGRQAWLVAVYTFRRWFVADRCFSMASSLALQTLLSVVPTVGVVLFFLSYLDPRFGEEFVAQIARALSPDAERATEIASRVIELGENVDIEALGPWGFGAVVVLAYLLFSTLERTVNHIWRVSRSRNVVAKFTMFYTLATLAPVVVFYSLAEPMLAGVTSWLITPVVTTTLGLVLINRLIPNQPVRWPAALAGGLLSASLFEFGKLAFGRYLSLIALHTYEGVYGSLAILPVFIVWSYLSWLIVLLGVELSFVVHHLGTVRREGYVHPTDRSTALLPAPGRTAARLLLAICDNYSRRDLGTRVDELNERFELGVSPTHALAETLEAAGLIAMLRGNTGYVPSRPLEQIKLAEVLHLFDGGDIQHARADVLAELYGDLDQLQQEKIGSIDYADLVERESLRHPQDPDASESSESSESSDTSEPDAPPAVALAADADAKIESIRP